MKVFILFSLLVISVMGDNLSSKKITKDTMQLSILDALSFIMKGDEQKGIKTIKFLIKKNPQKFKNNYLQIYRIPNLSKYASVLKSGYNRLIDILTIQAIANQTKEIDKYMQDSLVAYIFFSSKKEFMTKHLEVINYFKNIMNNSKHSNTKLNQEIFAVIKANYLISQNQDKKAYELLKKYPPNNPKLLKNLRYFSSIKDIPIFKDREKLLQIINIKMFKLKEAQFEHNPKFLFDFHGEKIVFDLIEKNFNQALKLLKNNQEVQALVILKKLIILEPQKIKHLYQNSIKNTLYTDILVNHYSTYFDGMLFNSFVAKGKDFRVYAEDSAVTYIMFTSKPFMTKEHKKIINIYKKQMGTRKITLETIAIFEANLLLMQNKPKQAYIRLSKETPYSLKSIALIRYFSPFKGTALFESHEKLLEAMNLTDITLHNAVIPDNLKHYYTIDGKKIK